MTLAILTATAGQAVAEDWQRLSGAEVREALTSRVPVFEDGAQQDFLADGRTIHSGGGPSEGQWRIDSGRYCSVWPPSDRWACYDVDRSGGGLDIRFSADDGSFSVGRYNDLQ